MIFVPECKNANLINSRYAAECKSGSYPVIPAKAGIHVFHRFLLPQE
jgi:hypothetical protein